MTGELKKISVQSQGMPDKCERIFKKLKQISKLCQKMTCENQKMNCEDQQITGESDFIFNKVKRSSM